MDTLCPYLQHLFNKVNSNLLKEGIMFHVKHKKVFHNIIFFVQKKKIKKLIDIDYNYFCILISFC